MRTISIAPTFQSLYACRWYRYHCCACTKQTVYSYCVCYLTIMYCVSNAWFYGYTVHYQTPNTTHESGLRHDFHTASAATPYTTMHVGDFLDKSGRGSDDTDVDYTVIS